MPANVQVGNVEVPVDTMIAFLENNPSGNVSFSAHDALVLASVVAAYTGPLNTTTIKDTLTKLGVKFV